MLSGVPSRAKAGTERSRSIPWQHRRRPGVRLAFHGILRLRAAPPSPPRRLLRMTSDFVRQPDKRESLRRDLRMDKTPAPLYPRGMSFLVGICRPSRERLRALLAAAVARAHLAAARRELFFLRDVGCAFSRAAFHDDDVDFFARARDGTAAHRADEGRGDDLAARVWMLFCKATRIQNHDVAWPHLAPVIVLPVASCMRSTRRSGVCPRRDSGARFCS